MTLKTEGETHVIVTRYFAAPEAIYRAHIEPGLIQKWMLGPEGWTMPVCISEAKPGGKTPLRRERRQGFPLDGRVSGIGTTTAEIVHIERMHLTDPTPDNHLETRFDGDGNGTLITTQ